MRVPESSDEFVTDSSDFETNSDDCSNEKMDFKMEILEKQQEHLDVNVNIKSESKFKYKESTLHNNLYDEFITKDLASNITNKRTISVSENEHVKESIISSRDEPGFNLYRKAYCEMDEEEVVLAWTGLPPREHKLWRKRASDVQSTKPDKLLKPMNLFERARNIADAANFVSGDLDLPALFPDAAIEVKKLLAKCADQLSQINMIRMVFGSSIQENVKKFTKLIELQKYVFTKALNNDTIGVESSYLTKRFVTIRSIIFKHRLKSPAMRPTFSLENLVERGQSYDNDDFVYVQTADSSDIRIARIKEKYLNGKVILGCQFVMPNSAELEQICPIYRNNVIMVNDGTEFRFKSQDIVGRCIVLNFSDYITARPTDIPEKDVYFCTHLRTSKRLIQPLVIDELTNILENYSGEVYYFAFNGTEDLVHDNQVLPVTNVKVEKEEEVLIKTEEDYDGSFVNSEMGQEVQVKKEYGDEDELVIPDMTVQVNDFTKFSVGGLHTKTVDQPLEIILYDDTTNTINLADTEDVLFVVDKSDFTENSINDEVIEID